MLKYNERSGLVQKYWDAHNADFGIEGVMLAGCGLDMNPRTGISFLVVDVFSPRELSHDEKVAVTKRALEGTPIEYKGEFYNVAVRRFRTDLPKWALG